MELQALELMKEIKAACPKLGNEHIIALVQAEAMLRVSATINYVTECGILVNIGNDGTPLKIDGTISADCFTH